MHDPVAIQKRFEEALEAFVEKARQDRHILAAVLFGSLSHDRVWEKSDIDLMVVTRDDKDLYRKRNEEEDEVSATLVEYDVNLHVFMKPRSAFKKMIEGSLQSSFMHSAFAKSRLLFTHDETIRELYDDIQQLRARDRQAQFLRAGSTVLPSLYKAEKWFHVRHDLYYSFLYIMYTVTGLAQIEVFLHRQLAGREVIQQAQRLNPAFFEAIYTRLIDEPKTEETITAALALINRYLEEKIPVLFQPVLDYLAEEGSARSVTDIETYFDNQMNVQGVTTICEWLADKDIITKMSSPMKLTTKSNVTYEEMAFFYMDD